MRHVKWKKARVCVMIFCLRLEIYGLDGGGGAVVGFVPSKVQLKWSVDMSTYVNVTCVLKIEIGSIA